jgi:hypothetical protein
MTVLELIQALSRLEPEHMGWDVEIEGCDCTGYAHDVVVEEGSVLIIRTDGEWRSRDQGPMPLPPLCTTIDTHDWHPTEEPAKPGNAIYRCTRCEAKQVRGA